MRLSRWSVATRIWDYVLNGNKSPRPAVRGPRGLRLEALEPREVPAVVYDPAASFSSSSSTSGPWQYGSAATLTGSLTPGEAVAVAPSVDAWGAPALPVVFHNPSASDVTFSTILLHGGELALHPGANGEYAGVRFTAPSTASYTINASFAGRDQDFGGTDAHILVNGVEVFAAQVPAGGAGTAAPLTVGLAAGDLVDFRVGYGANHTYYNDSTALLASITQGDGPPALAASAADGFSPLSNTNGPWAFGFQPAGGGTFTGGTRADLAPGVVGWGDTTTDHLPGAFKNLTGAPQQIRTTAELGAGEVGLHPGINGEWATARYTVQAAGVFSVTASFAGRDESFGGTDAHVLINGVEVYGAAVTDATGAAAPALTLELYAGDVVDFAVGWGPNGTYYNDTTALSAAVTLLEVIELKLNDGEGFKGTFDVPSEVSTDSSDQVVLSSAAGTNISLVANPVISSGELYQLDIAIGDGQITFATLDGVELSVLAPSTPYPPDTIPSSVRLIGTVSALNAALANSVYSAASNTNGGEQDTIRLLLSGLGERVTETGVSLGTENHAWLAIVAVKREKPTGPAPTPGQTQTLQGASDYAIPRNSFVGISDKTVSGDSTLLWLAKPSSATQESGIKSWDDLISKMEAGMPPGGYSALVLSGHGSGGGVAASGSELNGAKLTPAQADKLKAMLKDGAPVILFACQQGKNAGCQTMADKLGRPVIANKGDVNEGNSGEGDWVRFNP